MKSQVLSQPGASCKGLMQSGSRCGVVAWPEVTAKNRRG